MGCTCSSKPFSQFGAVTEFCDITLRFEQDTQETKVSKKTKQQHMSLAYVPTTKGNLPKTHQSISNHVPKPLQLHNHPCVISGELMKYHPGLTLQFISRYCVLTNTEFKYYKSIHSYTLDEKPLFLLPVSAIDTVCHTNFLSSEKEMKFIKSNNSFQFEIFVKDENEIIEISRNTDKLFCRNEILGKSAVIQMEDSVQDGRLMKRPIRNEAVVKVKGMERSTWSVREVEWWAAEGRMLFSAKSYESACCWVEEIEKLII